MYLELGLTAKLYIRFDPIWYCILLEWFLHPIVFGLCSSLNSKCMQSWNRFLCSYVFLLHLLFLLSALLSPASCLMQLYYWVIIVYRAGVFFVCHTIVCDIFRYFHGTILFGKLFGFTLGPFLEAFMAWGQKDGCKWN